MTATHSGSSRLDMNRRAFLKAGAAGLIIPITMSSGATPALAGSGAYVSGYVQVATNNIVTLYIGQVEMGQGIMTGFAQVLGEELKVNWANIRVEHGPPDAALFGGQITGGSTSMKGWYTKLSQAGANAREQLRGAAAAAFSVSDASLITMANGCATYNNVSKTYGELASAAAAISVTNAPLTGTRQFIGQRQPRVDIPAKVDGSAVFGIDVRLPGMVHAAVVHCPTIGGAAPAKLPTKPGSALAIVGLGNAIGVVANDTWTAIKLAEGLKVTWVIPPASANIDTAAEATLSQGLLASTNLSQFVTNLDPVLGNPDVGLANATGAIDASYQLPHLAHACLEPLNCTVNLTSTTCEVWVPTQAPQWVVKTVTTLTGLAANKVKVNTTCLGGGLGRKIEQDYVSQAVKIAMAVKKPVKLTWSRKQDFQNDKYRPSAFIRIRAGLAADGSLSMIYRNVSSSIAAQSGNPESTGPIAGVTQYVSPGKGLSYAITDKRVEFAANNVGIPLGYWRSVGESYNTFAMESAIDEIALASAQDPYALRTKLLSGKSRELAVLKAAFDLAATAGVVPSGNARGMAFLNSFGSIVALVAEVSVNKTGVITANKFFCALDCGIAVNPDQIEAQIQSGIVQGLTAALWGQATFTAGKSNLTNFNSYRMLKLKEMPLVKVKIVTSDAAPGGVGETVVPLVAPALANAYAKLTGTRIRTLPFYPGSVMGDL